MEAEIEAGLLAKSAECARGVGAIADGEGVFFGAGVETGDEGALEARKEAREVVGCEERMKRVGCEKDEEAVGLKDAVNFAEDGWGVRKVFEKPEGSDHVE